VSTVASLSRRKISYNQPSHPSRYVSTALLRIIPLLTKLPDIIKTLSYRILPQSPRISTDAATLLLLAGAA